MAVKIFIKRSIPPDKADQVMPLFQDLRSLAMDQPGYISGETLHSIDRPWEIVVISTWQTVKEWQDWIANKERLIIQGQIDMLLGKNTQYEVYQYG
ncbi:MAG: antibiotic biosynthesis monooxygenase [Deltaproteobacteria bacterium]|jgi:heme-degrading monooxygenase HmoA|nr:antibiotic biosynthesis monooxygenase [Deltaproteobacteria bacterium]MBW2482779.1 antibiotic biosynthesis monooxygenase [Deltaproteobacteria bacterium]